MSIVAWDGKTLAADKQATNAGFKIPCTKLWLGTPSFECPQVVLAITGEWAHGQVLNDWYKAKDSDNPAPWPKFQETEAWTRLVVVRQQRNGHIIVEAYEKEPMALNFREMPFMAWGAGCDFAIGAMAQGASAIQAVEITNRYSSSCGLGVDSHTFK